MHSRESNGDKHVTNMTLCDATSHHLFRPHPPPGKVDYLFVISLFVNLHAGGRSFAYRPARAHFRLKVLLNRSTSPLVCGWYSLVLIFLIPITISSPTAPYGQLSPLGSCACATVSCFRVVRLCCFEKQLNHPELS